MWLPLDEQPVLMLRKGLERARLESPITAIHVMRSPGQFPQILAEEGRSQPARVGIDQGSLSWGQGQSLSRRLQHLHFEAADMLLAKARAVKSEWELSTMRLAGQRHDQVLGERVLSRIRPGMSEREIAGIVWEEMFALGHQGLVRMRDPDEELFLGPVSAGDSGNYSTVSSGPVGYRGAHPAVPQLGYQGQIWLKDEPLILDMVFQLEGYHTDRTQVYFSGDALPREVVEAHAVCQDVYAWLKDNLRPGALPSKLYAHCLQMAQKLGWEEGFMGLGENKVPFVGHGIGIYVDDWPVMAAKFDDPLEENMVLALEPKIGVPGYGMVGVEHTCVVGPQGGESLTGEGVDILSVQEKNEDSESE